MINPTNSSRTNGDELSPKSGLCLEELIKHGAEPLVRAVEQGVSDVLAGRVVKLESGQSLADLAFNCGKNNRPKDSQD